MSFQLAPRAFWWAELISQFFCYSNCSKNITYPLGKLKTEFTSPIARSTSPGRAIGHYFLCTLNNKVLLRIFYLMYLIVFLNMFKSSVLFLFWAVEFPAVLLNTSTGEMESEFHMFVQPSEHARLSEFCTELTGITQVQWPTFLVSLWSCCTFSQELRTIVMLELASTSKWDYYPLFNLTPLLL